LNELRRRTHIDLFSGIGGFALAARWNGVETIAFCEIDENCRAFLGRKYPGVPVHEDVRTFDGREYAGAWLLTGGVPCQPVSCAGKRRGAEDDRWLWPEALRIVSEARPDWVIFENPPGIRTMGLDGILAEMENLGYATVTVDIPACAVDSPQIRHRYWIVSNRKGEGFEGTDTEGNSPALRRTAEYAENGNISDADEKSFEIGQIEKSSSQHNEYREDGSLSDAESAARRATQNIKKNTRQSFMRDSAWSDFEYRDFADGKKRRAKPGICLLSDGISRGLLSALGNAIVPQVAAEIIRAIILSEEGLRIGD
jgi:DNA (cytosine-5)-methyltransferase 1